MLDDLPGFGTDFPVRDGLNDVTKYRPIWPSVFPTLRRRCSDTGDDLLVTLVGADGDNPADPQSLVNALLVGLKARE